MRQREEKLDRELIGKLAYKKRGFFSGLIGIVQENNNGITPYKLVFQFGAAVGIQGKDDIVIVGEEEQEGSAWTDSGLVYGRDFR